MKPHSSTKKQMVLFTYLNLKTGQFWLEHNIRVEKFQPLQYPLDSISTRKILMTTVLGGILDCILYLNYISLCTLLVTIYHYISTVGCSCSMTWSHFLILIASYYKRAFMLKILFLMNIIAPFSLKGHLFDYLSWIWALFEIGKSNSHFTRILLGLLYHFIC